MKIDYQETTNDLLARIDIHSKFGSRNIDDWMLHLLDVPQGSKILDVGCGHGEVAFDLAGQCAAQVTAMDLCEASVRRAQRDFAHPGIRYLVGDALTDLPAGPFDVVVLSNVLEHLPGRPAFLRRLVAAARPGRVLVRVPLYERDWAVALRRELGAEWRLDATHATEYTLESFLEETREAGLVPVHAECRWGQVWSEPAPRGGGPA